MATSITDGTGKGYAARIDDEGRLYTRTTSESEIEHAASNGRAFNINTEFLTVSSSGENALLYVKNNENVDVVVAAWFIGTGIAGGTNTQASLMRVYTNPTAGTLIASASAVTPVNRRLGDNRTIDVDAYKGGDGYTITGQDATPVLYQTQGNNSRNFGTVYLTLPKGSSLAVTYEPNGAQPIEIYTGFQVYKADVEGVE